MRRLFDQFRRPTRMLFRTLRPEPCRMGTKDFKLGPLVLNGYMQPGERALSCSVSGVEHFADLGPHGEIIYNGEVFHSPSAFSVNIKRIQNPKRMADDGWTSVRYRGDALMAYREMLKNLVSNERDGVTLGAGGGYGGSALTASPLRTSVVSRPSRRPKRKRHGSFEESAAPTSSPEDSDWDRSVGPLEVNGPSMAPGDEEWQGPVSRRARGVTPRGLTPAPVPEPEAVDEAALEAANYTWIQCEEKSCQKWRKVEPVVAETRDKPWICSWNPDPMHQSCDIPQEKETAEVFTSIHTRHMQRCTRPPLASMTDEEFQADLCQFLTERNEADLAKQLINKRVTCNNSPLDIFNLYRQVMLRGGFEANEDYDAQGRWKGRINFAGEIFKKLTNYTENNKATSVGNQLMSNYKKFLLAYERAHRTVDLPDRLTTPGSNAEGLELLGLAAATDMAANDDLMGIDNQRGPGTWPLKRYNEENGLDRKGGRLQEPVMGSRYLLVLSKLELQPERAPGTLLLAQDLHNPLMHWPVMVVAAKDLPRSVLYEGVAISPSEPQFPYRLEQINMGRIETCYPVMVLGTESMGWVEAAVCRPYTSERASSVMNTVSNRLTAPADAAEATETEAQFRALKVAVQYDLVTDNKQGVSRAMAQAAGIQHVARNLLHLEGRLPVGPFPGPMDFVSWQDWRRDVKACQTAAQLARQATYLYNQLLLFVAPARRNAIVEEVLPLLGAMPGADGIVAPPSVLGLDDAVFVLTRALDWDSLRRPAVSGLAQASPAPTDGEGLLSSLQYNGLNLRHSGSATNLATRGGWGKRTARRPQSNKAKSHATPEPARVSPGRRNPPDFATSTPVQPNMADEDRVSDFTPRGRRTNPQLDDGAVCSPIADMVAMTTPTLKPIATRVHRDGVDQEAGLAGELGMQTMGGPETDGAEGMEVELRPHPMNLAATPIFSRRASNQPFNLPQPGVFSDQHQLAVQSTSFPPFKVEDIQMGMSPSPFPGGNMSSVTGSAEDAPHCSTDDDQNVDVAGSVQQHAPAVEVPQPPESPMPQTNHVNFGRQT